MKIVTVRLGVWVKIVVSTLLLSSCGGGNSAEDSLPEDDCTPTLTTSTGTSLEVDINGNITIVPTPTNTISGCGATTGPRIYFDGSRIVTRFENTEDFDVWNCIREDGSSLHYAAFDSTVLKNESYIFEIDPDAEDLYGSQQLYSWRAPYSTNGDMITLETRERVNRYAGGIESEWTKMTLPTIDTLSFTSSTKGAMECKRTRSVVDLAASRFDIQCRFRGPLSAC